MRVPCTACQRNHNMTPDQIALALAAMQNGDGQIVTGVRDRNGRVRTNVQPECISTVAGDMEFTGAIRAARKRRQNAG
jgi:hypothetical protein